MSYRVLIRDKAGDYVGEFTSWKDLSFRERLNNYGTCQFTVPNSDTQEASMRLHEVVIEKNGVIVWAGELAHKRRTLQANSSNRVTLTAFTFMEMLTHMHTPPFVRYDNEDQGEILKDLVDLFQTEPGGDLGLTFGTVETTVSRDREYSNYNIMEAWRNMSQVQGGPDFNFKPNKEIDIVASKGIDKSVQFVFEWGLNMEAVQITEDFVNPGNEAIVLGSGFGSSQNIVVRTDTSSRDTYGLRQRRVSEIDVSQTSTLNAKGDAVIREYKQPQLSLEFRQLANSTPVLGSLTTGDTVRVIVDDGVNINNRFRIYTIDTVITEGGKEENSYLVGLI